MRRLGISPDDPLIYGRMAHAYAHLGQRDETLRYVEAAEKLGGDQSAILLDTGDALLTLGDRKGAMDRFARALEAPDANRVDARLAIARLMVQYGQDDDAKQQISLAFAESRIGEAPPVTADNLIEAANLLLAMHDFDLAAATSRRPSRRERRRHRRHRIGEHLSGARQDQAGERASSPPWVRSVSQPELRLPAGAGRGLSPASRELERVAGCFRRPISLAAARSPSWKACRWRARKACG